MKINTGFHFFQGTFNLKNWEKEITFNFDPLAVPTRQIRRVNIKGSLPVDWDFDSVETTFKKTELGVAQQLENLSFYYPDYFVAGQIHIKYEEWQHIFIQNESAEEIRDWVRCVVQYIRPFKGIFWGEHYDQEFPTHKLFNNANRCRHFMDFISDTIKERLINGSVECLGRVGDVPPLLWWWSRLNPDCVSTSCF